MDNRTRQHDIWSDDYYERLGVSPTATLDAIKAAYRELVQKYHPDRNDGSAGSTEAFKRLGEAYTTLSDPVRRQEHDARRARTRSGKASAGTSFDDLELFRTTAGEPYA